MLILSEEEGPLMGQGEERRFSSALGSGRYRELPEVAQLPRAAADITAMARLFDGFGYQTVLAGLGQYDSADQFKRKPTTRVGESGLCPKHRARPFSAVP